MGAESVASELERVGLMPVIRTPDANLARRAAEELIEAGATVVEIALGVPDAIGLIRELSRRFGSAATIGAGTVLSAAQGLSCLAAGARFLVAPGFDRVLLRQMRDRDACVIPGALSPTEVTAAWHVGPSLVKIFPCSALGGVSYVQTLHGLFPDVRLLPTGSIELREVAQYIHAGACVLGVGAAVVDWAAVREGRPQVVRENAAAFLAAIRAARAIRCS